MRHLDGEPRRRVSFQWPGYRRRVPSGPRLNRHLPVVVVRCAPVAVAVICAIAIVLPQGVSLLQAITFLCATLWSVQLPGVLVLRLCRGQGRSLLEEMAFAFVVGLTIQLLGWALFVVLGIGSLLVLYPLLVVAAALLTPPWRARLRSSPYTERHPWWACWSLAVAFVWSVLYLANRTFAVNPLPPARVRWYPDLYWHVSVAASARTSVPPLVPQVSGETLKYHWFSHAHMAADSLVSGVDVLVVASRLWYIPSYAVIVCLTYLLASRLAGTPKAGLVAVVLILANASINPIRWISPQGAEALVPLSPSEIMGLPVLLVTVWWLVEIVRGSRPGRLGWVLLMLLLLGCAGSKSSNLPVILCGLLLVAVVQLLTRPRRPQTWIAAGATLGAILVTAPFLLGGSNVSKLAFLALPETQLTSFYTPEQMPGDSWQFGFLLVLGMLVLVQFAAILPVLSMWRDPGAVLLLGIVVAGFSATLLVFHPSASEVYFLRGVLPLADILIAWGLVHAVRRGRARWWHAGVGALAGGAILYVARLLTPTGLPTAEAAKRGATTVLVLFLVLLGLGAVVWRLTRSRRPGTVIRAVLAGVLVGAAAIPSAIATAADGFPDLAYQHAAEYELTPGAVAGTTWLRTHTPQETLVATNVHCRRGPTRRICDARALWVTGLSERRAYVESWGYTDEAYATANHPRPGEDGVFYWNASFYDQKRLLINDAAFRGPTPYVLRTLYDKGVRYLIGDDTASTVSPKLDTMAERVFRSGDVTVYRLRRP